MNVLIVYAHPEPQSFNGAMKELAVSVLNDQGHAVKVSDLYAMQFQAVATGDDFTKRADSAFLKYQTEQEHAEDHDGFVPDISAEHEKLRWADFVLFQFPLWWFSLPAIMKGWVDRVFSMGYVYGGGKFYDKGGLKGKKAMLAVTTGGSHSMYQTDGVNGNILDILFHIQHGMLYFAGMEVLPPYIVYQPAGIGQQGREQALHEFKNRLLTIENTPVLPFHPLSHYDEQFRLKFPYRNRKYVREANEISEAVRRGNEEAVANLLHEGVSPNAKDTAALRH